jgi:hypothetical protein
LFGLVNKNIKPTLLCMRDGVTQETPYGCGIACFAFVAQKTYAEAAEFLGPEQTKSNRFIVSHFRDELNRFGLNYTLKHVRPGAQIEPVEGEIVLLRRSKQFPVGHYLAHHGGKWMDPRINLQDDWNFTNPISGYRNELPGEAMYILIPE